jgi:hypothetical protein
MSLRIQTHELRRLALFTLGATGLASLADAQATFSIDWHSPTVGAPNTCSGVPITEGDVLVPFGFVPALGPLPVPCISISGGFAGLGLIGHAPCVGHPGGTPCRIEVDALSYGTDAMMQPQTAAGLTEYLFSTDEYAVGGVLPVLFPSIATEFPCGDSSTDVWRQGGLLPTGPLPPFAAPVGHIGVLDGNGLPSCTGAVYVGTGLIEPNFPGFPNIGDNLDAFDWDQTSTSTGFPATGVYYSLDAAFIDPLVGVPNTGTALGHGFMGSDILWSPAPGGPPLLWAPGPALGLNLINLQEDDLDALAIWENGSGAFEPSLFPYDWVTGATDMVLFSVRRGSPVIGMPDSIFGIPITEGDILTTPLPTFLGGVSPFPGIFCAGENIGLMVRVAGAVSDDLNALDVIKTQFTDCNGNGVDDSIDISNGTSTDVNGNGVPDECEIIGSPGCFCPAPLGPCGNNYPTGGCRNSTGVGGLLTATGSGSVALDNLVLSATQLPPNKMAIMFGGTAFVGPLPFGDGLRCAGGSIKRFTLPSLTSATGTFSAGPGLAGAFGLVPFVNWTFQCWFRDPAGPCGNQFNTTHSQDVLLTP